MQSLGAQIYACGGSMQHFKVSADDFFLPDIRIGTYPTFVELMNGAGVQVFLQ